MHHSKKTRVQQFNDIKPTHNSLSKFKLNNQKSAGKKRYIAATVLSGVCVCGLLAISILVPLIYSLYILKNDTTTSTLVTNMVMSTATTSNSTITTSTTIITNATMTTTPSTTTARLCTNGNTAITFDDSTSTGSLPVNYMNISWTNGYSYTISTNTSGYYTGTVSRNYTLFNPNGNPMIMQSINGNLLTLYSAAAAAAWNDNLQLTVDGYNSSVVIVSNTYTLQVFTVSYLTFSGYSGLDSIKFTSSGGTTNAGVGGSGKQFAMDNICLSFI